MPAQLRIGRVAADGADDGPPPGAPPPRQAAGVILLRGGGERLEVLLLRRSASARFMPDAWVFPGGAVDAADGPGGHRAAAVRELDEEAGIRLPGPDSLVPFSRWITPPELPIRFDTRFFLAAAPAGATPRADGTETVAAAWHTPADALAAAHGGRLLLVFPTRKQLEQLAGFATADAALAWADGREVAPVTPRVVGTGEAARVVLPGEPGLPG
jgi:8-oxo-dGTP pyrophosphatase MutT (NUDIX family)